MRQILVVTLVFTIIFGASFWYGQTANICPAPIKYRVGNIDERFGLSPSELKDILFKAELVWEDPTKRELFVYDDNSSFTVNLIYDERQQLVHTEEEWRTGLDKQETDSKTVMDKVEKMGEEYSLIQEKYKKQRELYETHLQKYNAKVESFNKDGGAPKDVFDELQSEQKDLAQSLKELLEAEKGLNVLADEINSLGEKGNKMIEAYNDSVNKYNDIFGNRDIFTQGDFQRERINVYKFKDKEELTRVLVHEFGHSLGMAHVEGEGSVMYYLMTEQSGPITLSEEDKRAMVAVCGNEESLSSEVRRIIRNSLSNL
jgi:vacuolar-type H+-ATPase subunit I/STV1